MKKKSFSHKNNQSPPRERSYNKCNPKAGNMGMGYELPSGIKVGYEYIYDFKEGA